MKTYSQMINGEKSYPDIMSAAADRAGVVLATAVAKALNGVLLNANRPDELETSLVELYRSLR